MNNIEKLYNISQKKERIILGLMSGTSLDGLDLALCKFYGSNTDTKVEVLKFITVDYQSSFKEDIKQVFSKEKVDLELLCLLNEKIGLTHAEIINKTLRNWGVNNNDVDLIASHGQTIYHAPKIKHQKKNYPDGTLQIGDGDHIAVKTGIITISDFRQKHIAAGGEGAPLAVYGDYILFSHPDKNRILLNIGGISNFTWLPSTNSNNKIFSTDTGPGNTLSDQFMQAKFGLYYDKDAEHSKQGRVSERLLNELLSHSFFKDEVPKSTGPEIFNLIFLEEAIDKSKSKNLTPYDILATLCEFTAKSVSKEILKVLSQVENKNTEIFISGGGLHNPLLMERLQACIPFIEFKNTAELGVLPDAKEAVLFALLANETISGGQNKIHSSHKTPVICMGKISLPQ